MEALRNQLGTLRSSYGLNALVLRLALARHMGRSRRSYGRISPVIQFARARHTVGSRPSYGWIARVIRLDLARHTGRSRRSYGWISLVIRLDLARHMGRSRRSYGRISLVLRLDRARHTVGTRARIRLHAARRCLGRFRSRSGIRVCRPRRQDLQGDQRRRGRHVGAERADRHRWSRSRDRRARESPLAENGGSHHRR